jgi:hypothetical protein
MFASLMSHSLLHDSFRRKKNKDIDEAHYQSVSIANTGSEIKFDTNELFADQELMNPLFDQEGH